MKTIFDEEVRNELADRINALTEKSISQWGKMNVYQMTKHNTMWNKWVLGKGNHAYKQEFLGRIFGKMALKSSVKDATPMKKGMPAGKFFTVKEKVGDMGMEKEIWVDLITEYAQFSNDDFIHDFFGKMTREEIGIFAYKHSDHHLRQFGV